MGIKRIMSKGLVGVEIIYLLTLVSVHQVAAQVFTDPLEVDSNGLLPIDFEPRPNPIQSLDFNIDGDASLETIIFTTLSGPAFTRFFSCCSTVLVSEADNSASDPLTIDISEPVQSFAIDVVDTQFVTVPRMAFLAGICAFPPDPGCDPPLEDIIEALDTLVDPRGSVVRAFDSTGTPVPVFFEVQLPIGGTLAQGGPVFAVSIPATATGPLNSRISLVAAAAPISKVTLTAAVPGSDFVPVTGDFIAIDNLDFPVTTTSVEIDIKPGSDPNSINLCSNGAVPIAILGSATFDVNDINTATLRFAEASVKVVGKKDPHSLCSYEDVNDDGFVDLVCHFVTTDIMALGGESTSATVNGELLDGTPIEGTDSINIVKDTCN